jgi:hypothetical protein
MPCRFLKVTGHNRNCYALFHFFVQLKSTSIMTK